MVVKQRAAEQTMSVSLPIELYRELEIQSSALGMTTEALVRQAVWVVLDDLRDSDGFPSPREVVEDLTTERSVDDVSELYDGEWILMKVTELNDRGNPEKGIVLAHSKWRGDISARLAQEPSREDQLAAGTHRPYYIFHAFPRVPPTEKSKQALLDLVAALRAQGFAATTSDELPTPTTAIAQETARASKE